jgi:hypothetical protein
VALSYNGNRFPITVTPPLQYKKNNATMSLLHFVVPLSVVVHFFSNVIANGM